MKEGIPFRCQIINALIDNPDGLTPEQLYSRLKDGYSKEGQCKISEIDEQLMSLKGVGLVKIMSARLTEDNLLECTYKMTEYGIDRARKYIANCLTEIA